MNRFECIYDHDNYECPVETCEECQYYSCRYCFCASAEQCEECEKSSFNGIFIKSEGKLNGTFEEN